MFCMEVQNKGKLMEKSNNDNLRIRTLRKQIVDDLNNSCLPFEVLRMVLNEILHEVNDLTETAMQKEIEALKEGDSENVIHKDGMGK